MFFAPNTFNYPFQPTCPKAQEVAELNKLKGTLKQSFEQAFGSDAFKNYYLGQIKVQKYDENDRPVTKGEIPWLESRAFNPHFRHETLADDLGLNFLPLHPILQEYFMAVAMQQDTNNPLYANIADDLFTDFKNAARQQNPNLTTAELDRVKAEIAWTADVMIEHTLPPQLRAPEAA